MKVFVFFIELMIWRICRYIEDGVGDWCIIIWLIINGYELKIVYFVIYCIVSVSVEDSILFDIMSSLWFIFVIVLYKYVVFLLFINMYSFWCLFCFILFILICFSELISK